MTSEATRESLAAEYARQRAEEWRAFTSKGGPPADYWEIWEHESHGWKQVIEFLQPVGIEAPGYLEALEPLLRTLDGMEEVDVPPLAFTRLTALRMGFMMPEGVMWSDVETFYVNAAPRIHRVAPFTLRFGGLSAREDALYLGVDDGGALREVRRQLRIGVMRAAQVLREEGVTTTSDPFVPSVDIAYFTGKGDRRRVIEAVEPYLQMEVSEHGVTTVKLARIASDPFEHYPDIDIVAEIGLLGDEYRKGYHN